MTPRRLIPARLRAKLSTDTEPVVQNETIRQAVSAVVALLVAFGLFVPSPAQVAAVIGVLSLVSAYLAKRARSKVTPVTQAGQAIVNAYVAGYRSRSSKAKGE